MGEAGEAGEAAAEEEAVVLVVPVPVPERRAAEANLEAKGVGREVGLGGEAANSILRSTRMTMTMTLNPTFRSLRVQLVPYREVSAWSTPPQGAVGSLA